MGAFFMPGAFLTATQQTAAKVLNSSMEMLTMVVDVIEEGDPEFTEGAVVGSQYLVKDTFIEAAAWKNGALAPPNKVAVPPIQAPQPMARKAANPKRFPGLTPAALTISATMGISMAATACSLITKDKRADKMRIDHKRRTGLLPK